MGVPSVSSPKTMSVSALLARHAALCMAVATGASINSVRKSQTLTTRPHGAIKGCLPS